MPFDIGNTVGNALGRAGAKAIASMDRNAHADRLLDEIAPDGATKEQRQHVKDMLKVGVSDSDIESYYAQGLDKAPNLASEGSNRADDIVVYARQKPHEFDLSGMKFESNGSEKLPIAGSIRIPSLHVKGNELYGTVRVNVENFGGNPDIKYITEGLSGVNGSMRMPNGSVYKINVNFVEDTFSNMIKYWDSSSITVRSVDNLPLYLERHGSTNPYTTTAVFAPAGYIEVRHLVQLTLPIRVQASDHDSIIALSTYVQERRTLWNALLNGGAGATMR